MGKKITNRKTKRKVTTPKHAHQRPLVGKIQTRLNKVLAMLRRRGRHTIGSIAEELEVSYDTIKRTIHQLRVEYGIKIERDTKNQCIRLVEKVAEQPGQILIPFTAEEARVVAIGAKALLMYPETGFGQVATKVHEKLLAQMPSLADENDEPLLSFGFTSKPIYRRGIIKKLFDAKRRRRQLHMYYQTPPDPPQWRDVEPYDVRLVNEIFYLIANCHKRGGPATFCATRIWALKETGKTYEIPADFDIDKFLKGNCGIVGGGKRSFRIVVRFAKKFAYLIQERKWPGETKRLILPDGSFELRLRLRSLWEFARVLKAHPGNFTVLQPLELRQMIAEDAYRMYCNNKIGADVDLKVAA